MIIRELPTLDSVYEILRNSRIRAWRRIGIMEKKRETTIVLWGYIGILYPNNENHVETNMEH